MSWLGHRTGIETAIRNFLYEEIPASSGWHQVFGSIAVVPGMSCSEGPPISRIFFKPLVMLSRWDPSRFGGRAEAGRFSVRGQEGSLPESAAPPRKRRRDICAPRRRRGLGSRRAGYWLPLQLAWLYRSGRPMRRCGLRVSDNRASVWHKMFPRFRHQSGGRPSPRFKHSTHNPSDRDRNRR